MRHCYVVVSELVGTDRKSVTTRSRISKTMVVSLTVMALCAGMTSGVMAADTATGTGSGVAYGKAQRRLMLPVLPLGIVLMHRVTLV